MITNETIDSTNAVVLLEAVSWITILTRNDGAIDRIKLPTMGETKQVLYVIHKKTLEMTRLKSI